MRSESQHVLIWLAAGWLVISVLLVGCAGNGGGGDKETTPGSPQATLIATGRPGTATTTDDPASPTSFVRPTSIASPTELTRPEAVDAAVDVAAVDFGLERDEIRVEAFEQRAWPSTALGCPEPGRSYAQIVIDGYRVVLRVEGQSIVYHTDGTGAAVVQCQEEDTSEP